MCAENKANKTYEELRRENEELKKENERLRGDNARLRRERYALVAKTLR